MKRYRFSVVAMITAFATVSSLHIASASAATTQPASPQRLEKLHKAMAQLDLSTEQKNKIKTVLSETKSKLMSLKSTAGGGTVDRSQAREIVKAAMEKVVGILTPGQKTKLKELMKSQKSASSTKA